MNVFVLCSGRTGSKSFITACSYISNYSSGHETRTSKIFQERFDYQSNHIEADNRLIWFFGELEERFPKEEVYYVHLKRDEALTARSFTKRFNWNRASIIRAFHYGILMNHSRPNKSKLDMESSFLVQTVNKNITNFLSDKPHKCVIELHNIRDGFRKFWNDIGATGDLNSALSEFDIKRNSSKSYSTIANIIHYLKNSIRF